MPLVLILFDEQTKKVLNLLLCIGKLIEGGEKN